MTLMRLEYNISRIAIYGAGKLTRSIALNDAARRSAVHIACVIDDTPPSGVLFLGKEAVTPPQADIRQFDAILLSTDSSISEMMEHCRSLFPKTIPVFPLYT